MPRISESDLDRLRVWVWLTSDDRSHYVERASARVDEIVANADISDAVAADLELYLAGHLATMKEPYPTSVSGEGVRTQFAEDDDYPDPYLREFDKLLDEYGLRVNRLPEDVII